MINLKNLNLNDGGFDRQQTTYLGDVTAATQWPIFIAPLDCKVKSVTLVSTQACPPDGTTASTTNGRAFVFNVDASGTTLGTRGGTATAVNTDSVSANVRYVINLTSGNSLTKGAVLQLSWSAVASGALSKVLCTVEYVPLLNRGIY